MKHDHVNRRDFNRLTVAAMSGLMAGSFVGCGGDKTGKTEAKTGANAENKGGENNADLTRWEGKHVCRGLNACKGHGKGGKNACAGQGECATVEPHSCGTNNTCKNLGGCGDTVASNECKGQGGCHVPLMESAYETAYKKFKADMEAAGKADLLPAKPPGPPPMPE